MIKEDVMVVGSIGDMLIPVINIHAPNKDDDHFFKNIANIIVSNSIGNYSNYYPKW